MKCANSPSCRSVSQPHCSGFCRPCFAKLTPLVRQHAQLLQIACVDPFHEEAHDGRCRPRRARSGCAASAPAHQIRLHSFAFSRKSYSETDVLNALRKHIAGALFRTATTTISGITPDGVEFLPRLQYVFRTLSNQHVGAAKYIIDHFGIHRMPRILYAFVRFPKTSKFVRFPNTSKCVRFPNTSEWEAASSLGPALYSL